MFSDIDLWGMGIDPGRCRAKARLFKTMAGRQREEEAKSDPVDSGEYRVDALRSQQIAGSMRDGFVGQLYQISAECLFLLQDGDGGDAISLAGKAYQKAGLPYGMLLTAIFPQEAKPNPTPTWRDDFVSFVHASRGEPRERSDRLEFDEIRSLAMRRPEQMTWLLLGAANVVETSDLLAQAFKLFHKTMEDHGHSPVGPLGIPVSAHIRLLDAIVNKRAASSAVNEVFGIAMARRSETLSVARGNTYLWERVRSPVALFDFHLLALTKAAVQHRIIDQNTLSDIRSSLDSENTLAELIAAPMQMAFNLS